MASKKYNYNFIDELSDKLKCSICLDVAEDPKQHEKCGKMFCSECIEKNGSKPCPSCRGEKPNYFTDMRGAQEIRALGVKCCNVDEGCKWIGSVGTLEKHIRTCEFELVPCKYNYIGCEVKKTRNGIKMHEENDDKHHLHLSLQSVAIPTLSHGEYIVFKMTEFSSKKRNNEVFFSDPFYTHSNGYKMHFKIYANGRGSCEGSHLSVSSCLLRGPFDRNLQWPFSGTVHLQIVHPTIDNFTCQARFVYKDGKHGQPGESRDSDTFITHSVLSTTFLKSDSLYFRVWVVFSESLPWLECGKQVYPKLSSMCKRYVNKDPLVFKLENFSSYIRENINCTSSKFYTHPKGYRMFLKIYSNGGEESVKGKYISVYAQMSEGHYDAILSWPFLGTVNMELLNQSSDTDHYVKNLKITRESNMHVDDSWGYPNFIKHSDLQYDDDKQYLMDDALYFRVSVTVDNHKPWLTCTPLT